MPKKKEEVAEEINQEESVELPTPEELGITEKEDISANSTEKATEEAQETENESAKESSEVSESSDIEKEALAQGWVPKDQFQGDEQYWRSAQEFVERGKLYDTISGLKRENRKLSQTMEDFALINKRQAQILAEERANELLEQKRLAIQQGNVEQAEELEKAYSVQQNEAAQLKATTQMPVPDAALEFMKRNHEWFNQKTPENAAMYEYAIRKENNLRSLFPDLEDEQILTEVEKSVKSFYPTKFIENSQKKPPAVAVSAAENVPSRKRGRITYNDLPDTAKSIVRRLTRYGNLSRDEYAEQLLETGALRNE